MFEVFAFDFDTPIKTISPLINCLISDAVSDYSSTPRSGGETVIIGGTSLSLFPCPPSPYK